jgi:hypothetical protein
MSTRRLLIFGFALVLSLILTTASDAEFILFEVHNVPVERLVANLEKAVKKDPKDVDAVINPKNEHRITSGLQLFGSVTFWLFWNTGYDALSALDDNLDGKLTGSELAGLAIWEDSRNPGVCDPGEVKPLSEYGIVAVSCRFERDTSHPDHIACSPRGVTFRNGTTRPTFDIILKPHTSTRAAR